MTKRDHGDAVPGGPAPIFAKAVRGVERQRGLVADAGGDGDVVGGGVENVPDESGAKAAPELRGKNDQRADVQMAWLRALDFRDCRESVLERDAEKQRVGRGDLCSGSVKWREVANAEDHSLYAIRLDHDRPDGLGHHWGRVGEVGYAVGVHMGEG